jgi:hypothetical protein
MHGNNAGEADSYAVPRIPYSPAWIAVESFCKLRRNNRSFQIWNNGSADDLAQFVAMEVMHACQDLHPVWKTGHATMHSGCACAHGRLTGQARPARAIEGTAGNCMVANLPMPALHGQSLQAGNCTCATNPRQASIASRPFCKAYIGRGSGKSVSKLQVCSTSVATQHGRRHRRAITQQDSQPARPAER